MFLDKNKILNYSDENKLWNDYNKVFFHYVMWFIAGLFSLFLVEAIQLLLLVVYKNDILLSFYKLAQQQNLSNQESFAIQSFNQQLGIQIFTALLYLGIAVYFAYTAFASRKLKSYYHLSSFVINTLAILIIVKVIMLVVFTINNSVGPITGTEVPALIAIYVVSIVASVLVGLVFLRPVSLIKKSFVFTRRRNEFMKMQEMFKNSQSNPNGFDLNAFFNHVNNQNKDPYMKSQDEQAYQDNPYTGQNDKVQNVKSEKDLKIEKLLSLPKEQLHEIAKILNIFGYEKLDKKELAEKIYNYTKDKK
ncbi:hypothetical protein [Mycoplasmopsis synoviae]|uniref:hypothetical protein n=1 Tax=Mycoplasmopsis synoviae TaxID=2109 RepID=UPI00349E56F3